MKILTVSGTRPDFIRLMPTVKKLDKYFNHKLVWAGQNFEECLAGNFFKEFNRTPDIAITQKKIFGITYIAHAMVELDKVYKSENPDCILVLGDTNASLCASYTAKRLNIPLFHLEAGNRCYDPERVPEEVNRYMIDSIADWHLCYTQRAREQLLLEGKKPNRIIVVGNPIVEAIKEQVSEFDHHGELYYLATIHRKENLNGDRLKKILKELNELDKPVKLSMHPTLKAKMEILYFNPPGTTNKPTRHSNISFFEPTNFKEFLQLEYNAQCVITDSGTIPEECHELNIPCVLLRFSTERPELLESNDMIVCSDPTDLKKAVYIAIKELPQEPINIKDYHTQVSSNIIKILMRWKNE